MAECKACGTWFSSSETQELCPECERALERLNGYVVPVVRCKDCKYFETPLCENENNYDNWFCADGERKVDITYNEEK